MGVMVGMINQRSSSRRATSVKRTRHAYSCSFQLGHSRRRTFRAGLYTRFVRGQGFTDPWTSSLGIVALQCPSGEVVYDALVTMEASSEMFFTRVTGFAICHPLQGSLFA